MFETGFWLRLTFCWAVVALATVAGQEIDYRLPTALAPTHYTLLLHPNLETGNFTGQEVITIKAIEATKQIILHSQDLTITSVYVLGTGDAVVEQYQFDEVRHFLIIDLTEELAANTIFYLGIIFEGQTQNKLVGLYSSTYQNPEGEIRKIATTQFEPTHARQAYPCFDEPAMKATYDISVIHPTNGSYDAFSNMNKIESMPLGENTLATFATSVAMSTYVACVIVADFDSQAGEVNAHEIGYNFSMNAYVAPHQLGKVKFALDFGIAVTEYYIQYFKIPYPLPKLDMAAIPDFQSNAMEHWGLVTYRETALLYDENYSSTLNKQSIAAVLAHEITHQWLGNLVTMKWWNDLWLNEGFARFMQYKGVNAVNPAWGMLEQFQIMALHPVLEFDAKLSSHPIVQEVKTPDEIVAIFDTISYEKAGSILRMLESLVGEEIFQEAVTNYLTKYQYNNTETDDFLTEVADLVSDFDVKQLMRTWTEQMGYPVLNVQRSSETTFTITQQRFLSNKDSYDEVAETSEFDYKWSVPITYVLDTSEEARSIIMNYNVVELRLPVAADVKWIKLNVNQLGYYRVNYDESTWNEIIQDLISNPALFAIADRAHLLNDAFALADASQLSYTVPLEMTAYLAQEQDFVPWYVAATKLEALKKSLMFSDSYVSYLTYARTLLTNAYNEVGWTVDADDHLKNRLRVSVLGAACALGIPDCLNEAAERFSTWIGNPIDENRPAPDLREVVYYYGVQQTANESTWEQLLELYKSESDASEKVKLMYGLSAVQDGQLLYRLIELANDESIVRSQDYMTYAQYIAANPVGTQIYWEYYREQWPQLVARFGLNSRQFGKLIVSITGQFASQVKLEEVQQFYSKYPEAGAGAASRQEAIETIKYNINWQQQNIPVIANWLDGTPSPLTVKNPL